jgi:ribosomal protein L37E
MQQTVKCSFCGTENPAGQEACAQCGTPLVAEERERPTVSCPIETPSVAEEPQQPTIKCPHCGSQNLAGQQFCGACGARLVAVAQEVLTAPTKEAPPAPPRQVQQAPPQQAPSAPAQRVPPAQTQQVPPPAPAQYIPPAPAQQAPARVVSPVIPRQQVEVKPTWGLAWGLWWRMVLLGLLIGGLIWLIAAVVMVLGFGASFSWLPFGT